MKLNKSGIMLICSGTILGMLCFLYSVLYVPISYVSDVKEYNPQYIQGDVLTYINYAKYEIAGRSFFEWFLKMEPHNISVVYFSWIHHFLSGFDFSDVFITSFIFAIICLVVFKIGQFGNNKGLYASFSLLTSLAMIVYMQTFTKEIVLLPFMYLALSGIQTRNYKTLIISIFFLCIIRVWFAFLILAALAIHFLYKKLPRKSFYSIASLSLFLLPAVFTKVFTRFTMQENMSSVFGIYTYYLLSLKYYGLNILWLPFKITQNLAEPMLLFYNQDLTEIIINVPVLLDFLTASAMLILLFVIWKFRANFKLASDFTHFLLFFIVVYLAMVGSVPIVHFRYLVPLLPILGITADRLSAKI